MFRQKYEFWFDIRNAPNFVLEMAGIYIHIPFCKQACHYCDFHFSTNTTYRTQIIHAIVAEIALQKNYLDNEPIKTIYFGGGTPSLLSLQEVDIIFQAIYKTFQVVAPEVTFEANPDDLLYQKLIGFKEIGINRLSIGIQSFDDSILKFLNRAHDARLAFTSFAEAREAGFNNISVDLMYSIPGQDSTIWKRNIDLAIALGPEHISAYALTIEPKTVFGKWKAAKKIKETDSDSSAQDLLTLIDHLGKAGFDHYEVSNFSKPGFISNHNSSYWKAEKYLGIGPSAHSYNGVSRQYNISNNNLYLKSIDIGKIPSTCEILTREDKINDCLLTTLRTSWGTDLKGLAQNHGYDLLQLHGDYVQRLLDNNLAILVNKTLILTTSGRLIADKIASDLFL
ncbi:MAG TPA: radical SAM family heme chaperone HemW [Chryseolinea sp.]|nr:radical SAM family heme chaperone HemW [Chryseolinea sp.]